MSNVLLNVPDISCEHCENTITKALENRAGVRSVSIDIPAKQVSLEYDEQALNIEEVRELLAEEDYPVESVVEQAC